MLFICCIKDTFHKAGTITVPPSAGLPILSTVHIRGNKESQKKEVEAIRYLLECETL